MAGNKAYVKGPAKASKVKDRMGSASAPRRGKSSPPKMGKASPPTRGKASSPRRGASIPKSHGKVRRLH